MKIFFTKLIFLIFVFSPFILSQTIKRETTTENSYTLDIELNSIPFKIIKKNSVNTIHFINYFDETIPGHPILPSKDLFIAIPPDSKPNIKLLLKNKKEIQAEPELNPNVFRENDSTLVYSESKTPLILPNNQFYKVNGFLWIGNNYCLHLTIYQYQYDYQNRTTINNSEVTLVLTFNKTIANTFSKQGQVSNLIINKNFASENQSKSEFNIQTTDDWINYNNIYVKIGVAKDYIYRVDYSDLLSLGVSVNQINPKTFQLFNKGKIIPIYVKGEDDGSFDPGDFIEFAGIRNMGDNYRETSSQGEPYKEYLGRYTDTTIYWLTWGGNLGNRVQLDDGNSGLVTSDTLKYYDETIHLEKNNWFDYSMANQVEREMPFWAPNKTWNEGNFGVGVKSVNFSLSNIYPDETAKMFVKLQDYASDISSNSHLLALSLNNYSTLYDSGYINKYDQKVLQANFNSLLLSNGTNILKLHSLPTSASLNACILDWYEMEYPRYLNVINDSLLFSFDYLTNSGVRCFSVNNIQTSSIDFWKFGDTYKKYIITPGNNKILVKDTIGFGNKFLLIDESRILKPKLYYQKKFTDLRNSNNQADYLAITNKSLLNKAQEYSNFISTNYNVQTKLIDIDDIYDEFAYGYFNPESIRDFLMNTHTNWQIPYPKYVFLIGDANYDYHLNKYFFQNTPPVQNIVPSFGAPVSDNWFVSWDSTGAYIPQMNIGRIPIHNVVELDNYLQRHQQYLSHPYDVWNKSYLFFSGGKDDQNELDLLRQINQNIINNDIIPQPIGGNWHHFYKTLQPITNFGPYSQNFVQDAINVGAIFISYLGHSGTQTWDNSISDPSQLQNIYNRNPLITDFGCSTAKFAEPDVVSFSELFINSANGQAISYIGNSSLGFTSTATIFPSIFYKKILRDSVFNISEAQKLAKLEMIQDYGSSGTMQLFTLTNELIGDPIISLPIPKKPNLVIQSSETTIPSNLSDLNNNVKITSKYYNWGKAVSDSFLIIIKDDYLGSSVYVDSIYKRVPSFEDSIEISIPIQNRPGEHLLKINLDAANVIDEIYENDNDYEFKFYVTSSKIKILLFYNNENAIKDSLLIINPSVESKSDSVEIEIAQNKDYVNSILLNKKMDSVFTIIKIPEELANKRIWIRGKIKGDNSFAFEKSVYTGSSYNYALNDSISFSNSQSNHLSFYNNSINLDTNKTEFKVISAGYNDGNTAVIFKNGENFVLDNTLRGHHICVFEDSTYSFITYRHFDLLEGTSTVQNYITFLDSITDKQIVIFAVSDEGYTNLSSDLKTKIKEFGSKYIDSLVFRGSWAFIGKRGANTGSLPEGFSKPYFGRVEIDTLNKKLFTDGTLITAKIGPSKKWESMSIKQNTPDGTNTIFKPIGIKSDGTQDTLNLLSIQNEDLDLTNISASKYPYIKLMTELIASNQSQFPSVSSIGANYIGLPELTTNYQVVSLDKDTVIAGENVNLKFWVYNVGKAEADSFNIRVDVINQNNSLTTIFNQLIKSLPANSKQKFEINYQALSTDSEKKFLIDIDPDNKILEYYKDNNFFTKSFYIQPDINRPTVKITFDNTEVINGDFVSKNPDIKISLSDESSMPFTDTAAVKIYLNERPIYYASNSQILSYSINSNNPKYVAEYKPTLEDGEYLLKVVAKDPSGNFADSASSEVYFVVSSETKLMQVYNYPNPFSNDTYFTFKLSQIPEEIRIRIYTIAGRLIKEIVKNSSELNYDLNRIYWNGKDADGNNIANGTYLYKVILKSSDKAESVIQKLVIMR